MKPFKNRAGKLIIAHGWSDGVDPPLNTVNYYRSVVTTIGVKSVDEFIRLYMVPGVYHNMGRGVGPNDFRVPMMTALERWVENGTAPKEIIATQRQVDGDPSSDVKRTRPLCPYPQVAQYRGTGSIDAAVNFACSAR